MKRVLLVAATVVYLCTANYALADTIVDASISTDTVWSREGSPYIVTDVLIIEPQARLTIEPGVVVEFNQDSLLEVLGGLTVAGSASDRVQFTTHSGRWDGIAFDSRDTASTLDYLVILHARRVYDFSPAPLSLSHTTLTDSEMGFTVYAGHLALSDVALSDIDGEAFDLSNGSDVSLARVAVERAGSGVQLYAGSSMTASGLTMSDISRQAIAVYSDSRATVTDGSVTRVPNAGAAVQAFSNSTLDLTQFTLSQVSGGEALSVFDSSSMTLRDTSVLDTDASDAVGIYGSSVLTADNLRLAGGTGGGIEVYSGSTITLRHATISDFPHGTGLTDYGSEWYPENELTVADSTLEGNATGFASYSTNSRATFAGNSIQHNATYGAASYGSGTIDLRDTYWGDPSGPYNDPDNLSGKGNAVVAETGSTILFAPWRTSRDGIQPSNVLFLPGIEGSRLYRPDYKGGTDKLWEPTSDGDVHDLFMNSDGSSERFDIYTKERAVIDELPNGDSIYKSFIEQMNALKNNGTIADWEPIAYDWRLSLNDILSYGHDIDGRIYYSGDLRATSTPYIEQTLRELAASSRSGRVTIVAHSNGGLVAKALIHTLGSEAPRLIDRIILVGSPQTGTPLGVAALLFGYKQGVSAWGWSIFSNATARALALNSPAAYHLLPSEDYLESTAGDANHPVIRFSGDGYSKELAAYGRTIANRVALADFLLAKEGGRKKPKESDLKTAEIVNPALLDYAKGVHASLDVWSPPSGIAVDEIAGWGVDTMAGLDFYSHRGKIDRLYNPIFTEDGDGTVTVPSALMMASSTNVKRYWVDLVKINQLPDAKIKYEHKNILEIRPLEAFISDIIASSHTSNSDYVSGTQPPATSNKKLTFILHSPLTLKIEDSLGNVTGLANDGSFTQDIPGSSFGQSGEVKYLIVPEGDTYQLSMHGQDYGTFSLNLEESANGVVMASSTIADVPTTASTIAAMTVPSDLSSASPLSIDLNGDGANLITIDPKVGETVYYDPPEAQAPAPLSPPPKIPAHSVVAGAVQTVAVSTLYATSMAPFAQTSSSPAPSFTPAVSSQQLSRGDTLRKSVQRMRYMPQTASALHASQQAGVTAWGEKVYTAVNGVIGAIKNLF